MPQRLLDLTVDRVDLVNAPASKGARVLLFKRDGAGDTLPAEVEAYIKRDFSADERKTLASSGAALPDGSFPISNKGDLQNAMRAIGRAKDPAKAKAHIRSRAKALGLEGELSDAFKSASTFLMRLAAQVRKDLADGDDQAVTFDEAYAEGEARELADAVMGELREMDGALNTAISSILADGAVTDKQAAIKASIQQFINAAGELAADGIEKATAAGVIAASPGPKAGQTQGDAMTPEIKKALGLAETATDADALTAIGKLAADLKKANDEKAVVDADLAIHKMSQAHQDYADAADMGADAKKAFAAKTPAERDAHMAKNPVGKGADEILTLASGATIRKSKVGEEVFAALSEQNARIAKQAEDIAKAAEREAVEAITKRVAVLKFVGKPDELAAILRTVEKADPKVAKDLETRLTALNEQLSKGKLFSEAGSGTGDAGGSAVTKIATLAETLRKADPKLSIEKARLEVRKQNPELAKQEREEQAQKQRAAA